MTACARCGYDPDAVVSMKWEFFIARKAPSLNDRVFNVGATRFTYAKERDAWSWEFRAARLKLAIAKATARRRVSLVRIFSGRERERDLDNLAGGMKALVDAMVREELLLDDSSKGAQLHYEQRRDGVSGVFVTIEDLV